LLKVFGLSPAFAPQMPGAQSPDSVFALFGAGKKAAECELLASRDVQREFFAIPEAAPALDLSANIRRLVIKNN